MAKVTYQVVKYLNYSGDERFRVYRIPTTFIGRCLYFFKKDWVMTAIPDMDGVMKTIESDLYYLRLKNTPPMYIEKEL